jgi:hypothetical protein
MIQFARQLIEAFEMICGERADDLMKRVALQDVSDLVDLPDLFGRELADGESAMGVKRHQALGFELKESGTNRQPRDSDCSGEAVLAKVLARLDRAAHDRLPDDPIDHLADGEVLNPSLADDPLQRLALVWIR